MTRRERTYEPPDDTLWFVGLTLILAGGLLLVAPAWGTGEPPVLWGIPVMIAGIAVLVIRYRRRRDAFRGLLEPRENDPDQR